MLPVGVFGTVEHLGDLSPGAPLSGVCGDEARTRTTGDCDGDLFPGLDAPDKVGGVLAEFPEAYTFHHRTVALVLLDGIEYVARLQKNASSSERPTSSSASLGATCAGPGGVSGRAGGEAGDVVASGIGHV